MVREQLESLIMEAMKNKDKVKTETFRAIKTAILNWETAKENINKDFKDTDEIKILQKLAAQYEETADVCNDGKHDELVADAKRSAEIIKEYLPTPVTENDIEKAFDEVCAENNFDFVKKNMGNIIKAIKEKLAGADGKMVSQIVAKHLN